MAADGSQEYKLNCSLAHFESDANSFSTSLLKYLDYPYKFAEELARLTKGSVVNDSHSIANKSRKRRHGKQPFFMLCV